MKALIIDPSKTYRTMLGKLLKNLDIDFKSANNAAEATALVEVESFDVICLSMYLEDSHAFDLCKTIRKKSNKLTPILLLTSELDISIHEDAFSNGITEIFYKKSLKGLEDYLRHFISRSSSDKKNTGSILYIEDVESQSLLVTAILEKSGFKVRHFSSALPALKEFDLSMYDLVITDILLKDKMSGLGLIRAIRNIKNIKRHTPILALTSFSDAPRRLEILNMGANDFISKPVMPEELIIRAKNLITTKKLIDQTHKFKSHVRQLSFVDILTSLYNRHYFFDYFEKALNQSHRQKNNLNLVLFKIDNLKVINTQHGHLIGDIVIQEVAEVLKNTCRKEDMAARYAGEEFAIILNHCDEKAAISKIEKVKSLINKLNPSNVKIETSFGIASIIKQNEKGFAVQEIINIATDALLQAKKSTNAKIVNFIVE